MLKIGAAHSVPSSFDPSYQGPVAGSLVSTNCWLRGIDKTYRFPWYLMPVSANHALSNPGKAVIPGFFLSVSREKYTRDPSGVLGKKRTWLI